MSQLEATTMDELEDGIKDAIRGLEPSYVSKQAQGWKYKERRTSTSPNMRVFTLRWSDVGFKDGGIAPAAAQEFEALLTITVDYNMREQDLTRVLAQDGRDLFDLLHRQKSPTLKGFTFVEHDYTYEILDDESESDDFSQVDFDFTLSFLLTRTT